MNDPAGKPSLLVVTTTFPRWPDDPGPAPFVLHHARALAERFQVTVLAPHYPGAALEEQMEGVTVKRFRYGLPERLETLADGAGIRSHLQRGLGPKLMAALLTVALGIAAAREIRRGAHQYVNSHWLVPSGLMVTLAAPRTVKHVITVHAADYDLLSKLPGGASLVRFMARRATAVVCVSERLADGVGRMADGVRRMAGPEARIITLPMGAAGGRFRFDSSARRGWRKKLNLEDSEKVVLFAGKLSPKKGVEVLIRAFAQLNDQALGLVIAGDGELRRPLEELAGELGLINRVTFLGALPNRELAGLYSAADAVAVPSVMDARGETEGLPVVILEALFAGRPVVATRLCGVPASLAGRGVVEVEPADPAALAAGLRTALSGEVEVDQAAVAAFDLKEVTTQYSQLWMPDLI